MKSKPTFFRWLLLLTIGFFLFGSSASLLAQDDALKQAEIEALHGPTVEVPQSDGRAVGDNCTTPIVVNIPADLPYVDLGNTTCGRGNAYSNTDLGYYDSGEDLIYEINVTAETEVILTMDPKTTTYSGLGLFTSCPTGPLGAGNYWTASNSGIAERVLQVTLTPGTYIVMVDTWSTPYCIPVLDFSITEVVPPPPPAVVTTFPFVESFEAASTTLTDWRQIQEVGTSSWTFATGAGGGAITSAFDGTRNARFVSSSNRLHKTKLVSPPLDLSTLPAPHMSFYLGQEIWFSDQNTTAVYYRISEAAPWVLIQDFTDNITAWTMFDLVLPNPSATYQVAFEGINNYGHANVIDLVTVFDAGVAPGIEILNANLDMGDRPIGAWMKPAAFEIVNNPGEGAFTISNADISNNAGGFLQVATPQLPYTLASGATTKEFGINNSLAAAAEGAFNGNFAMFYDRRAVITADYFGNAYTPVNGDVWEKAFNASTVTFPVTVNKGDFRDNYDLPGIANDGWDVVYKIVVSANDVLANISLSGTDAKMAVYPANFGGVGGPDTDNAIASATTSVSGLELYKATYYLVVSTTGPNYNLNYTTTVMSSPVAVTNLTPVDGAVNIVNGSNLTWSWGANTLEYRVVLGTTYPPATVVKEWATANTAVNGSYTLAGLNPNLQYFWRVDVRNNNGTTNGDVWGFTTTITPPTTLAVTVNDPGESSATVSATLNWTGPTNRAFIGYNVYRGGVKITPSPINNATFTDLGLARNTTYAYTVKSVYDEGESAASNTASVTTKGVGTFNGFVFDFLTNEPIEGARINIEGTEGNYSLLTDATGAYSTLAYKGTYDITASADDYNTQTLRNQNLSHAGTVSKNFLLMEVAYAVGEVVATEMDDNAVMINWSGTGGGGETTEDFFEGFESGTLPTGWKAYDVDADGFNWTNTASLYGIFAAHTGSYCMASASYDNDTYSALTPNNWLVTPAIQIAPNSELKFWVAGQDPSYAAEKYYVKVSTTGDAVANFTTTLYTAISTGTWQEKVVDLSAYAGQTIYLAFQHADVTDQFFIKLDDVTVTNTITRAAFTAPVAAIASDALPFRSSGMTPEMIQAKLAQMAQNDANRGIINYDISREKVYQPEALVAVGNTSQDSFVDFDWEDMEWGVYRWAVAVNYDAGQVSPLAYSNKLDKNMEVMVDVSVALNSAEAPSGASVTFTNMSEPDLELVYNTVLDNSGIFAWDAFRRGTYDIAVMLPGYGIVEELGVNIFEDKSFTWLLEEMLSSPSNLYVTPTAFASWNLGGGGGEGFEPFMEDFNDIAVGALPEGWTKSPVTTNWGANNGTLAGGVANQMRFYWAPSGTGEYALMTPMMNTEGQSELSLSFRNFVDHYNHLSYTWSIRVVAIANGVEYTIQEWIPTADIPAELLSYQLTDAHGVGAEEFQIAWIFDGETFGLNWWDIDDVMVNGSRANADRSLEYSKVFLDGQLITETTAREYQYDVDLLEEYQTYTAGVAAVYSTGQSETVEFDFIYVPCGDYDTPTAFAAAQVEGTLNVLLSWTNVDAAALDTVAGVIIYRDGQEYEEIDFESGVVASFTDEDLDFGTYSYCLTYVYASGAETCVGAVCADPVTITGGGYVNGTVTAFDGGAAIAGATVTVSNNDFSFEFTTNNAGYYEGEVLDGTYDYFVSADTYESQLLEDVTITFGETVTNDFQLLEFPYAVGDVVATEISDNIVQIDWSGGGGGGGGGTIAEWLYYDDGVNVDGIGGPAIFTWAIKFDPAQLTAYAGTSLTKISIYNRLAAADELRIYQGTNAATLVHSQTLSGLAIEAWEEVDLTAPVLLDVTKELWIAVYTTNGAAYPAGAGNATGNPNGDLITLDGTTWEHLGDLGLAFTWNLRGYVTDMATMRTAELRTIEHTSNYSANETTAFAASGNINTSANAVKADRELLGYSVYRTTCETGELTFLGLTLDEQFTDNTWGAATSGVYKWGVVAEYDNNESEVVFSNCLDKDMITTVSVTVTTNSGDSPEGTQIIFTGVTNQLLYEVELDESGYFMWDSFRKGVYDIYVGKNGFEPIGVINALIDSPKDFVWQLQEQLLPVEDLYVSPTGFATWRSGGDIPFESYAFDFEADANAWEIQGNVNGWQWGNNASLSSTYMTFDGNTTNFIAVNADMSGSGGSPIVALAKSPMLELSNADEVFVSFDYRLRSDAMSIHYSIAGGAPVLVAQLATNTAWATNYEVALPAEALTSDVQILFLFEEASTWGYGGGVDNVVVTDVSMARELQYYKVWLDGIFIDDTENNYYRYDVTNLIDGEEYFSEVAAVYSNGMSAKMNYTWTYLSCENYPGPEGLEATVNGLDVTLTWAGTTPPPPPPSGDGIDEDFEGGAMPEGWSVVKTNNSTATGGVPSFWTVNNYVSTDVSPFGTYHAGMWWDYAHQDEWLITPEFTCDAGATMNFWTAVYEGSINGDHYYVKVSTDGGTTWTVLWDASTLTGNAWNYYDSPYSIDLAAYAGDDIKLAFQAVDGDNQGLWYIWFVDNITVGSPTRTLTFDPASLVRSSNAATSSDMIARDGNTASIERNTAVDYSMYSGDGEFSAQFANPVTGTEIGFQNNSSREAVEIHYDGEYSANAVGTGGAVSFMSAVRFTATELASYYGDYELTDVKFVIHDNLYTNVTVKVWEGGSYGTPGTEVHSQDVTAQVTAAQWTTVNLTEAVSLTEGNEYWIGYAVTTTGGYPAGVDAGPMVSGKGAWMYFNNVWDELTNISSSLNYNWNIRGILNLADNGGGGGEIPEDVLGVNVYRDGMLIAAMVTDDFYVDQNLDFGTYTYCITYVYEDGGESCLTECVEVDLNITCDAPKQLKGEYLWTQEAWGAMIEWNSPINEIAEWLYYDDGVNVDGIGGPASFIWAVKFDPAQLAEFDGAVLTKIKTYNRLASVDELRIYEGNNAATLLHSQPLTGLGIEVYEEVALTSPVLIDVTKQLWIAVYTTDGANYPAGCGNYTGNPNSDLISQDGGATWDHLTGFGLNYSWNLRAFVTTFAGATAAIPMDKPADIVSSGATFAASGKPSYQNLAAEATAERSGRMLELFNVYRSLDNNNYTLIATVPFTEGASSFSYFDTDLAAQTDYYYQVTAFYDMDDIVCESEPAMAAANPEDDFVYVFVTNTNEFSLNNTRIYPNPATNNVVIESAQMNRITVMNALGQVVLDRAIEGQTRHDLNTSAYEAGIYLIRIETNEGVVSKRLTVVR